MNMYNYYVNEKLKMLEIGRLATLIWSLHSKYMCQVITLTL
jgi:hypothetical protein